MAYTKNDFEFSYTDNDFEDLTEGLKQRKPHKFQKAPKMSVNDDLIDTYLETLDLEYCANEFKMSMSAVMNILRDVGII